MTTFINTISPPNEVKHVSGKPVGDAGKDPFCVYNHQRHAAGSIIENKDGSKQYAQKTVHGKISKKTSFYEKTLTTAHMVKVSLTTQYSMQCFIYSTLFKLKSHYMFFFIRIHWNDSVVNLLSINKKFIFRTFHSSKTNRFCNTKLI